MEAWRGQDMRRRYPESSLDLADELMRKGKDHWRTEIPVVDKAAHL
ncbi:MAG: hypothetical protein ACFFCO_08425 [Promethearchaeota archaeon]